MAGCLVSGFKSRCSLVSCRLEDMNYSEMIKNSKWIWALLKNKLTFNGYYLLKTVYCLKKYWKKRFSTLMGLSSKKALKDRSPKVFLRASYAPSTLGRWVNISIWIEFYYNKYLSIKRAIESGEKHNYLKSAPLKRLWRQVARPV